MGFGEGFFKRFSSEGKAVGKLYEQADEEKEKLHPAYKELYDKERGILDANKNEIFARIVSLDGKGINEMDLAEMIPALKELLGEQRAQNPAAKIGLKTTIARWLAKETGTQENLVYACPGGSRINWIKGAEGIRTSTLH